MSVPEIGDRWPIEQTAQYTFRAVRPARDWSHLDHLVLHEPEEQSRAHVLEAMSRLRDEELTADNGDGYVLVRHLPGREGEVVGFFFRAWSAERCRIMNGYLAEDSPRNVRLGTACIVILVEDYLRRHPDGAVVVEGPVGDTPSLFRSLGFRPGEVVDAVQLWPLDREDWAQARAQNRTSPWFDWS